MDDEKQRLADTPAPPALTTKKPSWSTKFIVLGVGALVATLGLGSGQLSCLRARDYRRAQHNRVSANVAGDKFDWDSVLPSESLNWTPCYEKFQCARFEVPLDYAKPHDEKAVVAMAKYPSKYPVGHEKWKGPVLYNPGGPGGSGVDIILRLGENFSKVIGDEYDHIGFDPRGVGRTVPRVSMFFSEAEAKIWESGIKDITINSSDNSLARIYSNAKIMGSVTESRARKAAEHVSTAVVATDMLRITQAHGRDKLLYWGFSYGTVLGITYASMFPDNVGRLIVDGVVDTENYYASLWSNNLLDTDANLKAILTSCSRSKACALHDPSGPEAIHKRIHKILDSLKTSPIPVIDGDNYGLADYGTARAILFQTLYRPVGSFPDVARAFADLEKGNGTLLFKVAQKADSLFRCDCGNVPGAPSGRGEVTASIACGEGEDVSGRSLEEVEEHYNKMAEMSEWANVWVIHAACVGWKVRASQRYTGPFVGNTSHPMLFIGNTADPVTPLWAAKKMSKGFKDAVVLTQNSPGHCSLAAPSSCTSKYVRDYFRKGTLPPEGTVCEDDQPVFVPDGEVVAKKVWATEEERVWYDAVRGLAERFEVPRLGGI